MPAALDVALKDLRQKIRDRSAILIGLVAPFALAALFASILGGVDEQGFHARWALVDGDGGATAAALAEGPLAAMSDAGLLTLERLPSAEAARTAVADGRVEAAIILPPGFSAATLSGSGTEVELVVDPDAVISGQVARSVLSGFAHEVEAVQLAVATAMGAGGEPSDLAAIPAIAQAARSSAQPIGIADVSTADRQAPSTTYYAAAMAIFFVFLSAQFGLTSIHAERRNGTLARMLASPMRWWAIIAGKVLVSMVMGLVSMGVIVVGTSLLLGARWGDPAAVAALVAGAVLAATGVSLLAVAFTRTEEQAASAIAVVTMVLAILGGAFFPANQGPEILARVSFLTPHAWFLRGIADTSSGGDLIGASGPVGVLLLIAVVTAGLGLLRARRLVLG
jgi:ABC-2 type transport system permease protein